MVKLLQGAGSSVVHMCVCTWKGGVIWRVDVGTMALTGDGETRLYGPGMTGIWWELGC